MGQRLQQVQSSSKKPNIKLLSGRVPRGQRLQQVQSSSKKPNTKLLSGESATGVEATAS